MKNRSLIAVSILGMASLALAACSGGGGEPAAEPGGATGAGATEVTVYYGTPRDLIKPVFDAFKAAHPEITVNEFRQPTEELLSTLELEAKSGNPRADVVIAPAAQLIALQESLDAFEPYAGKHEEHIQETLRDPDHLVNTIGVNLYVLGYNTNEIDPTDAPTSWVEALDPQWQNKISIADPNNSASVHSFIWYVTQHLDGPDFGWDYFAALGKLAPRLESSHGTIRDLIMTGERPLGFILTENIPPMVEDGAPGAVVWPSEGSPAEPRGFSIMKNSPNGEAARILLDFLQSPEGQKVIASDYGLVPARQDVDFTFEDGTELSEITMVGVDSAYISGHRSEQAAKFHEALGN